VTTANDKYKLQSSGPKSMQAKDNNTKYYSTLQCRESFIQSERDFFLANHCLKGCHLTSRPRPNGRGFPGKPLRDLCSPSMARNVVQTPNAAHLANLASIFLERTKKRFKTLGGRTALLRNKNPRNLDALKVTPSRVFPRLPLAHVC